MPNLYHNQARRAKENERRTKVNTHRIDFSDETAVFFEQQISEWFP
jgi:hypothetical protein